MTLLSFKMHTNEKGDDVLRNQPPKQNLSWNVQIEVDIKDMTYRLNDQKEKIQKGW